MNDSFLNEQRREPDPAFARSLREQLRTLEDEPVRGWRWRPALAWAAGVAVVVASFSLPAVRVAAQNALDLFRVRSFAAVEIEESRIEKLKQLHDANEADPSTLMFEKPEVLQDPGKPQEYPSADLAGSAAGLPGLLKPAALPAGLRFETAAVTGRGEARFTVQVAKVRHLLDLLDIHDVQVPQIVDGQSVTVHMPPSVVQRYVNGGRKLTIIEGMSPEVTLPPGADLQQLGEIGLRVLGLDASEAHRMAAGIDWRSTLLVPVPANASTFRQVDVNGHRGLMIRMSRPSGGVDHKGESREGGMVLWTDGDRVLAVQSNLPNADILEVAQNLH